MPSPFYKTPETYAWSLSIQSQIAKDWATEIAYVGNRGLHLDYLHNLGNQPEPGLGDLNHAGRTLTSILFSTMTIRPFQTISLFTRNSKRSPPMASRH